MIAIIGAGIGGLAAAIALRRIGVEVGVFEQAAAFRRVGAAINMTPNAVKVLDGLGLGDAVRDAGFFSGFHADARRFIGTCDTTLRTALYERQPLDRWTRGNAALLGDSCHAMTPFMAQGAAMGLEDAAVLARSMAADGDWRSAIRRSERTRIGRAGEIQLGSHRNDWLRGEGNPDWVYGYDAWRAELA